MKGQLIFTLGTTEFDICDLIDSRLDDSLAIFLLETIQTMDQEYLYDEAMPEDIESNNDKFVICASDLLGVFIQFVDGDLCIVSLNVGKFGDYSNIENHCPSIIKSIVNWDESNPNIAFGSARIFSDDSLIPTRWSPIHDSLIPR